MSDRRRGVTALSVALVLGTAFFLSGSSRGADEGELLRQIKTDVFDQRWEQVLASCGQFITQFPSSQALSRSYYYKAQALEHIKGREAEAINAYSDYLSRFPNETGALREDAVLSRITLATSLYLKSNRSFVRVIQEGMDEKGYPRIYAAIQASKVDHVPARTKALPILKACASGEADPELKSECVVGLLRIDPKSTTEIGQQAENASTAKSKGKAEAPAAQGSENRLIRVTVFDKAKKQVTLQVNMPLAFWDLIFQALGPELQHQLDEEFKLKGIQVEKLLDSFKKGGKQTIVEIDDDEHTVKVWVE